MVHPGYNPGALKLLEQEANMYIQWLRSLREPQPTDAGAIAKLRTGLAQHKKEIAELEQTLRRQPNEELIKRYVVTRVQYKLCLWMLFPVNKLPHEILAYILHLVVAAAHPAMVNATRRQLTQVCSFWRSVALSTPTLWSAVYSVDPPPFHTSATCLARAKSAPLTIWIDRRFPHWGRKEDVHPFRPEHMQALMDLLVPHMGNVRDLHIVVDTWAAMVVGLANLRHAPTPFLLHDLKIRRSGDPYVRLGPGFQPAELRIPAVLFEGGAPSLRHVFLDGVHVNWNLTPLRNLLTLDLRRMAMEVMPSMADFQAMLSGSPRLQTLAFVGAGPHWEVDALSSWVHVRLPELHTLLFGDFSARYAMFVVGLFSAPNLRRLTLEKLDGEDYTQFLLAIQKFPEIRVLSIQSLELSDKVENKYLLAQWLRSIPKVKYLNISAVPEHFLDTLITLHPGLEPVLPKLETLQLGAIGFPMLLKILEERTRMNAKIRQLLLADDGTILGDDAVKLATITAAYLVRPGTQPELEEPFLD